MRTIAKILATTRANKEISDYQEERRVTIEGDVYLDAITGEYYDDKKNTNTKQD